jgi:hypothetical protein
MAFGQRRRRFDSWLLSRSPSMWSSSSVNGLPFHSGPSLHIAHAFGTARRRVIHRFNDLLSRGVSERLNHAPHLFVSEHRLRNPRVPRAPFRDRQLHAELLRHEHCPTVVAAALRDPDAVEHLGDRERLPHAVANSTESQRFAVRRPLVLSPYCLSQYRAVAWDTPNHSAIARCVRPRSHSISRSSRSISRR